MKEIMDGNEACARNAYLFTEVCGIYPITPSSPMATLTDKWSSEGKRNILGEKVSVVEMQSEAGVAGFIHGSLQAGSLTTTFTSSQGLLLMIPNMYKIAGELLPAVIHVAARSLSTHALSIFGDHQDIYATRSTGFALLASSSVEDAYYLSLVAHLSALSGSLPFIHFFDGFRTSHELNVVETLEEDKIKSLVSKEDIKKFKGRAINIRKNITRGTSQTEDIYFQMTEARNKYYNELPDVVMKKMEEVNNIAGTDYKPFNYYGSINAERVIVAIGSVNKTIKEVVDDLNKNGEEVGLIEVHLYRPFSTKYFLNVLPKSVSKIAVLDRTKEAGSLGEPLYLDVKAALASEDIMVIGGRYGLSSKNTTPAQIKAVFDNLDKHKVINNFTIGIEDDVTNLSLKIPKYKLKNKFKEIKVFGFGSDGMVSGCKTALKVIGNSKENYVQGYFEYDSKKSGGVTISHLRINNEVIEAPYYVEEPNIVIVSKESYLNLFDCLKGIKKRGILILNSNKLNSEINRMLPNKVKEEIQNKEIKFFVTKADKLANKYELNGKINIILISYLLKMVGCTHNDFDYFKDLIRKTYSNKDEKIVENNINAIDEATSYIRLFDKSMFTFSEEEETPCSNLTDCMLKRRGEELKVSDFLEHADGTFDGGTSKSDKRKISSLVPKWKKDKCIECNMCALVCPHAVIRPFSLKEEELSYYGITEAEALDSFGEVGKYYYLSVNEENCTGCKLCEEICPGKNGEKAIYFDIENKRLNKISEKLFEEAKNETDFNKYTIKGCGFKEPGFEFPGACAGCGETSYLKILTQLYKDNIVIANATGCSSIYGASMPVTPYKVPWINSLFEDNAEFGLGIYSSYEEKREKILELMYKYKDEVSKEMKDTFKKWILNINDFDITNEIYEEFKNKEEKLPKEIEELIEYIPARDVWIVGGDGWAYDIGYGGLDHVLHSNKNVKILILDSEVYSNTGGQSSKASKEGTSHEFSRFGKKQNKKDLFRIIMSIPNVYVASVSLKANMMQTLKAFKEAHEHIGPSVIIAYSPCIEHGIKGGLKNSIEEEKLLVKSGYNLLMRYNPKLEKLVMDEKEPDFDLYEKVFKNELRYKNTEKLNEEEYKRLFNENIDFAKKRYNYFKNISEIKEEE